MALGISIRRKRRPDARAPEKAVRRAQVLGTPDLYDWADATLYAIGRSLSESRKDRPEEDEEFFFDNAASEARVLLALVEEIQRRGKTPRPG